MMRKSTCKLIVIDAGSVPSLSFSESEYIIMSDDCNLTVGDHLYFSDLGKSTSIMSICLLLGKIIPVDQTEYGHRYLINFSSSIFLNNQDGVYKFSKFTQTNE